MQVMSDMWKSSHPRPVNGGVRLLHHARGLFILKTRFLFAPVAYNGMLYFMGFMSIIVYDPYSDNCHSIDFLIDALPNLAMVDLLGVSGGRLRLCQLLRGASFNYFNTVQDQDHVVLDLKVWEFSDYESGMQASGTVIKGSIWRLLHNIYFHPDIFTDIGLPGGTNTTLEILRALAYHPDGGDIMYFVCVSRLANGTFPSCKFSFNLRTKKLESLQKHNFEDCMNSLIPVKLPLWPTPIAPVPLTWQTVHLASWGIIGIFVAFTMS
ncbi:F-box protein family [Quillaja saponaria]|uniref:F-box protein family n=1 Tax=Quillaja saponaria TaxID=32244 RepID=A0AAD7LD15_QUISA|nr:F-box protein family [Quillaja saponaria]KAJ7955894.1 F-box protein family [Quillaja saponaria]